MVVHSFLAAVAMRAIPAGAHADESRADNFLSGGVRYVPDPKSGSPIVTPPSDRHAPPSRPFRHRDDARSDRFAKLKRDFTASRAVDGSARREHSRRIAPCHWPS